MAMPMGVFQSNTGTRRTHRGPSTMSSLPESDFSVLPRTGILSSRKAIYGQLNHHVNGASMLVIVDG